MKVVYKSIKEELLSLRSAAMKDRRSIVRVELDEFEAEDLSKELQGSFIKEGEGVEYQDATHIFNQIKKGGFRLFGLTLEVVRPLPF